GCPHRPAALRVKADGGYSSPLEHQRDAREVSARGAAGSAGEGALGRRAAARLVTQVMLEQLASHTRRVSRVTAAQGEPSLRHGERAQAEARRACSNGGDREEPPQIPCD